MKHQRFARAMIALLLALVLLSHRAGAAVDAPGIAWLSPGDGSRVVSPIPISAEILPEPGGLVRVELLDGQGQAIARQLLRVDTNGVGMPQTFTTQLPFEIRGEEEAALLTLTLLDAFYRPLALRSAQITLGAGGEALIEPAPQQAPWVTLTQPQPMTSVSGGALMVSGTVRPLTDNPIFLELLDETGRVIGARQVPVEAPGLPFDFEATLVYTFIESFTNARLVVRQTLSPFNATVISDSFPLRAVP
jgi:hypothetical protein